MGLLPFRWCCMQTGQFCFLTDEYYIDFPDKALMKNKETINGVVHDRPCFFAIQDKLEPRIMWLVPVSTKVDKYRRHYNLKIEKYGYCSSIRFGTVVGTPAAFLVQNMCPATERYIKNVYVDKLNVPVRIDRRIEEDVIKHSMKTLSDYFRGKPVIFPNVRYIKSELIRSLQWL